MREVCKPRWDSALGMSVVNWNRRTFPVGLARAVLVNLQAWRRILRSDRLDFRARIWSKNEVG